MDDAPPAEQGPTQNMTSAPAAPTAAPETKAQQPSGGGAGKKKKKGKK